MVLATAAADAGRYYVQAVNEKNGENKTSPSIYLNVAGKLRGDAFPLIISITLQLMSHGQPLTQPRQNYRPDVGIMAFGLSAPSFVFAHVL